MKPLRQFAVYAVLLALFLMAPPAHAADPDAEAQARQVWGQSRAAYAGLSLMEKLQQNNKLQEAKELGEALQKQFPEDGPIWAQSAYLLFMLQDFKGAQNAFEQALKATTWTDEQRRNLAQGLANSASAAGDNSAALAALEPLSQARDVASRLQYGRAQLAAKDRRAAVATARAILAMATTVGEREDGEHLLQDALVAIYDPRGDKELNRGYAYLRQGDDENGLAAFNRGFAYGSGKGFHYADAAYAAKRLNLNEVASAYFKFALDLDEYERTFSPQRVYGFQREVEGLDRHWGVLIGTPYHAGALDVWQGGVEAFWQPPVIGNRDGRIFQLFMRTYENFRNGLSGPIGLKTLQTTLGVRYKPLASQNIVLTAERLFAIGRESLNDWLFRVGYSTGDGTDLRVDKLNWTSWQIYAEIAYYLFDKHLLVGTEVRYGITWPVPRFHRLTLYPHALVAVEFDSAAEGPLVNALGPGLSMRLWFGEDRYHAPPGWLEIHANYRFADVERARGPALRATLSF